MKPSGIGLPIFREAFEIFEDSKNAGGREESHCILGVLVEVGVEDALILEVGLPVDLENLPAQIVQLEHGKAVWVLGNRFLNRLGMFVASFLTTGDQLCDDGEAVAGRSLGKIGPYLPCSGLPRYPPFGIAMAAGFVQSPCCISDIAASFPSSMGAKTSGNMRWHVDPSMDFAS